MHDAFEVVEKEIGNVIEISEAIAMWKMPIVIEKDLLSIYKYLKEETQEESIGIPYSRYVNVDWEAQMNKSIWQIFIDIFKFKWNLYVGIPTQNKLATYEPMQSNFIPKQRYIQTTHYGSYQKLGKTYKAIYHYAKEHNLKLSHDSFEFYQNNPKEVKPHELQTVVMVAIRS